MSQVQVFFTNFLRVTSPIQASVGQISHQDFTVADFADVFPINCNFYGLLFSFSSICLEHIYMNSVCATFKVAKTVIYLFIFDFVNYSM